LCILLSTEEKVRIRTHTFRELWDDLWIAHGSNIHLDGYERTFKKFELARDKILEYIRISPAIAVESPPWGFPKGKKNERETEIECAIREFGEETRLDTSKIRVHEEIPALIESYRGGNLKPYCIHYFIAETDELLPVKKYETEGCIRPYAVSEEAGDARWVTYAEACELLDPRKSLLLGKAIEIIEKM
jgi:8-oxo-dGTP pyrophosphatase MutT (NUDIX family)